MKNNTLLLALALGAVLSAGELKAQTIGVQFSVPYGGVLSTSDIVGVIPQGNFNTINVWNTTSSSPSGYLNNSDGNATGITLTYGINDDFYNPSINTTSADGVLLSGEDKSGGAGELSAFTFNNVPSETYDLIAYIECDTPAIANITCGSTTYYVIDQSTNGTPAFTSADNTDSNNRVTGNYVEFFNLTPSNNQITISQTGVADSGGNNYSAAFNGFQLQTVPEPSTYALFGLGTLLLLIGYRRRGIVGHRE